MRIIPIESLYDVLIVVSVLLHKNRSVALQEMVQLNIVCCVCCMPEVVNEDSGGVIQIISLSDSSDTPVIIFKVPGGERFVQHPDVTKGVGVEDGTEKNQSV